jgi:sterol 3beta-glucosyltransferase
VRILIPLVGSRGDVQPGAVLGLELQRRGHTVVVGAPPNFVDFVGSAGRSRHPSGVELSPDGLRRVGTQR